MEGILSKIKYSASPVETGVSTPHFHNGYELIYVESGGVKIEINGNPIAADAPAVVTLNPFEWHKILWATEDYRRFTVVLDSEILEREIDLNLIAMMKCRPPGFDPVVRLEPKTAREIHSIFARLKEESDHAYPYRENMVSNEIHNLLIHLYRLLPSPVSAANETMMRVQKYLDENYAELENVGKLSEHFFLSAPHLSRTFKAYSGYSPVEYLINTRLFNARLLLTRTSLSVTTICEKVGFGDVNHFTRQFKKKYGMSPLTFRRNQRSRAL